MIKLTSTNPARNYEVVGEVEVSSEAEIAHCVRQARQAKEQWRQMDINDRIRLLARICQSFSQHQEDFALLITKEMGKPIRESRLEVKRALEYFQFYLKNAPAYLKDEIIYEDEKYMDRIVWEPLGVAAVIIPWNYPFMLFVWGVIPNLLAGNTVVFKHSELCPLTGQLQAEIMPGGGLPQGVFAEIYGAGQAGEYLVNQDIDLIWFTGSCEVGKKLYKLAGGKFIKAILELGGSNPAVIFADADLDKTVKKVYSKRFANCGQVCSAIKRAIVQESIFDEFVSKLKEFVEKKKVGDPQEETTDIGSLSSRKQLELVAAQVKDALAGGARQVANGHLPAALRGSYYPPTLLTNIKTDMRIWREEVFGPVLPIIKFKTETQAVKLANDTKYGLGALICTADLERAKRVALAIEAAMVDINTSKSSRPDNPFGGYKDSGKGREHGTYGLRELCQPKVIAEEKKFYGQRW